MEPTTSSENSTTSKTPDNLSPEVEILSPPSNLDKTLRNALSTFARDFDGWTEQGVQISQRFRSFQEAVFKEEKVVNKKIETLENDKLKEEIRRRAAEKKIEELQNGLEDATIRTNEHERICKDLLEQATERENKISLQNKRFSEMFNHWKESEQLASFMETWGNGEGVNEAGSELQMLENNMDVLVKFGETMETVLKKEKVDNEKKISTLIDDMKKQALAMFSPSTQPTQTSTKTVTSQQQATTITTTPVSKVQKELNTKISTRSSTSSKRKLTAPASSSSTADATATQKRGRQSEPVGILKNSIPNNSSSKQNLELVETTKDADTDESDDCFTAYTVRKKVKKDKTRVTKS